MSKKIDIKRTLGKPMPPLSIEDVEAMTRQIHGKNVEPEPTIVTKSTKMNATKAAVPAVEIPVKKANYEETTEKLSAETSKFVSETTAEKKVEKAEKMSEAPPTDKVKRGRKPKMMLETERLLRVSVDLPESLFIQLKIAVIQQQTDMKTYIRQLVEKDRAN